MPVVVVPVNLLGLQLRGLIAVDHGGLDVRIGVRDSARTVDGPGRQRRGPGRRRHRSRTGRNTECNFQKVPALHRLFLSALSDAGGSVARGA